MLPTTAEKLQNFFGVFLQFQIGVDKRTAQQTPRTPEEELRVRNAQLEREIYLLKMENDLLKKVKELERGKD